MTKLFDGKRGFSFRFFIKKHKKLPWKERKKGRKFINVHGRSRVVYRIIVWGVQCMSWPVGIEHRNQDATRSAWKEISQGCKTHVKVVRHKEDMLCAIPCWDLAF